jgi:hypothetical protein
MKEKLDVTVEVASLEDAPGVYHAFKQNLIEIRDFDEIPKKQRKYLEDHGFLRKEVDIKYYERLIEDSATDIYVAKITSGEIIAFASIHKNKFNIYNFRTTLDNLYVDDKKIKELLTTEETKFVYLDQISVFLEYKRKGVATLILKKILVDVDLPVVAFIVDLPLANKASSYWHENNNFKLGATCDGEYKGKTFQWSIYIHWND